MTHRRPGVSPLGSGAVDGNDAAVSFREAIDAKQRLGSSKADAIRAIVRERPELHAAFVEAHNREHGPPSPFRGRRG